MLEKIMSLFAARRNKIKREIIVNAEPLETRVAVMENGRLEEYMVEHPDDERLVNCIFKGRIQNLQDDLQAAFVDIGLKKNAFLHYWDMLPDMDVDPDDEDVRQAKSKSRHLTNEEIHEKFKEGTEIIVQVTKGPISTKGPRVTANLTIPGRYLILQPYKHNRRGVSKRITDATERKRLKSILDKLMLPEEVGVIVRTVAQGASPRAFVRDLRNLLESWNEMQHNIKTLRTPCCIYQEPALVERVTREWLSEDIDSIIIDDPAKYQELKDITAKISRRARSKVKPYNGINNIFDHFNIDRQLSDAFARQVPLKSGGYLVIDETEALIAVDVNTGHYRSNGTQEEAILQVNLEAVEEVARQLRLRNIGGLVILDLIDMKSKKHQKQVYNALRTALKRDHAKTNVLQISELGLLEMSRQRQEESLLSALSSTCPCCNGQGVVKSPLSISIELQRELTRLLKNAQENKKDLHLKITIAPTVMQRLRSEDAGILRELQSKFNTKLRFVSELHRHPESFTIADNITGEALYVQGANRGALQVKEN